MQAVSEYETFNAPAFSCCTRQQARTRNLQISGVHFDKWFILQGGTMTPANAQRRSKSMGTPLQNTIKVTAAGQHCSPGSLATTPAALAEAGVAEPRVTAETPVETQSRKTSITHGPICPSLCRVRIKTTQSCRLAECFLLQSFGSSLDILS